VLDELEGQGLAGAGYDCGFRRVTRCLKYTSNIGTRNRQRRLNAEKTSSAMLHRITVDTVKSIATLESNFDNLNLSSRIRIERILKNAP